MKTFIQNPSRINLIKGIINESLHNSWTKKGLFVNGVLIFIIIFSVAIIPLRFFEEVDRLEWLQRALYFFSKALATIFTIEYILRIWSAKWPFRYIFSLWGFIDLLALFPFYLSFFGFHIFPEIFLIPRVSRILKLSKIYERKQSNVNYSALKVHGNFQVVGGEKVEKIVQKHPLVFFFKICLSLFALSLGIVLLVIFWDNLLIDICALSLLIFSVTFFVKSCLDYNYEVIYITTSRVFIQKQELFGSISEDLRYEAIASVVPNDVGILRWIFQYGDISICTSAGSEFVFTNAINPHAAVQLISAHRERVFQEQGIQPILAKQKEKEGKK